MIELFHYIILDDAFWSSNTNPATEVLSITAYLSLEPPRVRSACTFN